MQILRSSSGRFRCRRFWHRRFRCRYLSEVPEGSAAEGSGTDVETMKGHRRIVNLLGIAPEFISIGSGLLGPN